MRRLLHILLAALLPALIASTASAVPNVIVFVVEDMGVDKLVVYGEGTSPPATPWIDGIATVGVRFQNAWSNPSGTATRATLFTGRHGFRSGIGDDIEDPDTTLGLDTSAANLASLLKQEGFDTAAFGTWDLGGCAETGGVCTGPRPDPGYHPIQSGFDYYQGALGGLAAGQDYCDWTKTTSERTGPSTITSSQVASDDYLTFVTGFDAAGYVPTMTEPFLAWVSFEGAGPPLHRPPNNPVNCNASTAGNPTNHYRDMLEEVDAAIGMVLGALPPATSANTIAIVVGAGGTPAAATVAPFDPTHASGTPYEGGVNVPLIIGGVAVTPGVSDALVHTADLVATVAEVVDPLLDVSSDAPDSVSMAPYLGSPSTPSIRSLLYSERFDAAGGRDTIVRDAQYKWVTRRGSTDPFAKFFDLVADPFEQTNLLLAPGGLTGAPAAAHQSMQIALADLTGDCVVVDDYDLDCVEHAFDSCAVVQNGPASGPFVCDLNLTGDSDQDGYGNHCDADIDQNPATSDIALFMDAYPSTFGQDPNYRAYADMDCDGDVDDTDLDLFQASDATGAPGPSGLSCAGTSPCEADERENFLVILLDDIGVDKVGAYGEGTDPPATPEIDSLAQQGILFRNAWTNPLCSPTRTATISGRYGFRTGVGRWLPHPPDPTQLGLEPTAPNIANVLKASGYETAAFGKWHMAGCPQTGGECTGGPVDQPGHPIQAGFDYFAGTAANLGAVDEGYCSWDKIVSERTGPGPTDYVIQTFQSNDYATNVTVDDTLDHVRLMGEPWFTWIGFHASHKPLHQPPADPVNCEAMSGGTQVDRYDLMTEALDTQIGRLLSSMAGNSDVLDRTTIILLGDNGTIPEATLAPFDPDHAKGTTFEGGINVPFIVVGPHVNAPMGGAETASLVNSTDLFATIMDIAELDPCPMGSGCAEDSVSFLPTLQNPAVESRTFAYSENFYPNSLDYPEESEESVREGRYKLMRKFVNNNVHVKMFDLDVDPFETTNMLNGGQPPLDANELAAYDALSDELNRLIGVCVELDDTDTDCVPDVSDNCPDAPNGPLEADVPGRGNQTDMDDDLLGDACDPDDNNNPDDDGDGLLDIHETQTGTYLSPTDTGTDPFTEDTDGDLVGDGNEVEAGSDPNDPGSIPSYFTEKDAFLAHLAQELGVLDFDSFITGSLLSGATIVVESSVDVGIEFPAPITDPLDPNGLPLDLLVVENTGHNPTTTSVRSLGPDDVGNYDTFVSGASLDFTFDTPIVAFGLTVVTPEAPGVAILDDELRLDVVGEIPAQLRLRDRKLVGKFGGVDYWSYFLAVTSASDFTAASLAPSAGVPADAFLYNIDDLIAVPEAGRIALLVAGCAGLAGLRRLRVR